MTQDRKTGKVLDGNIDALSWDASLARLLGWAHARDSRHVTICNVHVVVSASRHHQWLGHGDAGWRAGGVDAAAAACGLPSAMYTRDRASRLLRSR